MSRKNLLSTITERKLTAVNIETEDNKEAGSPAMERNRNRGAFGAITRSIDELAEKAQSATAFEAKLLEGETVIDLDPTQIDSSFISDRMADDDNEAFDELVKAISLRGQDSPVLLRPHPNVSGRYMTVFGHRRVKVAKVLNRPVRAVVKNLSDNEHVIAQGQENSARADLSFIEKAVFANNMETSGYDRETIMAALSVDKTVVSKMISVTQDIPISLIQSIGAARGSGRDRWYQLAKMFRAVGEPQNLDKFVQSIDFKSTDSDARLELLAEFIRSNRPLAHSNQAKPEVKVWAPSDQLVNITAKHTARGYSFDLSRRDAKPFGEWISKNLNDLYEAFKKSEKE